jgi:dTDP-glucose pyrophosphorylase
VTRAVVLAAGRGTRMRAESAGARLDEAQRSAAERGLKGLIPFHGHPYLSYVLSALADGGVTEACLVVGPGDDPIRAAYEVRETQRLRLSFAVQERPEGTARALLAAEDYARGDPFLLINSDNYYPPPAVAAVAGLSGSGMAGFRRETLVERGSIPAERIAAYALVSTDREGYIDEIVEKPGPADVARLEGHAWISMTCWRFGPSVFDAARRVGRSARGEYELPDAVADLVRAGERFRVVPVDEPVLDLSSRADVAPVERHLRGVEVRL